MAQLLNSSFIPTTRSVRPQSLPSISHPTPRKSQIQAKIREIFMSALSTTMSEGKTVSWVKSEGNKLNKGDSVVVVNSDKTDMDVETFYDGYLAAIMAEESGIATVGSAITLFAETEDKIALALSKAEQQFSSTSSSSPSAPPPPRAESTIPDSDPIATVVKAVPATVVSTYPTFGGGKRIVASLYTKKLTKELNVDFSGVVGSGPMGRIVAKDVEVAVSRNMVESHGVNRSQQISLVSSISQVYPFISTKGT